MNIVEWVEQGGTTTPQATALIDPRQRSSFSFADLTQASAQLASLLYDTGLRPGDRILVFQPMSRDLYITVLALLRLGGVAVFVDPSAGRELLDRACQLVQPQGYIAVACAHLLRWRSPLLRAIPYAFTLGAPVPHAVPWSHYQQRSPLPWIAPCSEETPALITFTSGSTGQPKLVIRSHGFLDRQQQVLARHLQLAPGQRHLSTLPMFVLANLAAGATSILADADVRYPARANGDRLLCQIQTTQADTLTASPALLDRLIIACQCRPTHLPSLERVFCGGAPVFATLLHRLRAIAPAAQITAVYGASEAEPIALLPAQEMSAADEETSRRGGGILVGRPIADIEVTLLPPAPTFHHAAQPSTAQPSHSQPSQPPHQLVQGNIGEIAVRGPHVLISSSSAEHRQQDAQAWHRTGDAGYWDDQGRLWLVGRCRARLEDADGVLYPLMVEAALQDMAGVRRAAVVSLNGQRTVLLEPTYQSFRCAQASLLPWGEPSEVLRDRLSWAHIHAYRLSSIPVDRRHQSKINYPKLYQHLG